MVQITESSDEEVCPDDSPLKQIPDDLFANAITVGDGTQMDFEEEYLYPVEPYVERPVVTESMATNFHNQKVESLLEPPETQIVSEDEAPLSMLLPAPTTRKFDDARILDQDFGQDTQIETVKDLGGMTAVVPVPSNSMLQGRAKRRRIPWTLRPEFQAGIVHNPKVVPMGFVTPAVQQVGCGLPICVVRRKIKQLLKGY